jgi:hypothetical protein
MKLHTLKPRAKVFIECISWIIHRKYLQVAGDEAVEEGKTKVGVDTWRTGSSAALTPRNNTDLDLGAGVDDGTARVTLARVLSTLGKTSAEHGGGDGTVAVVGVAGSTADDGNVDLEEVDGEGRATGGGGSPASNGEASSGSGVGARAGELGVRDGGGGGDGAGKLHDRHVVVVGTSVVAGVDLDGWNLDNGSSGGAALSSLLKQVFYMMLMRVYLTLEPMRTWRVEAVCPTAQWAAVRIVLAFKSEPPQKWLPLFWRETM